MSSLRAQSGQSAVELVALLPALALLALLAWQVLAAASGWQMAAGAARAGARAAAVGAPAADAARATLPRREAAAARVSVSGDGARGARVGVAVPVPSVLPGFGRMTVAAGAGAAGGGAVAAGPATVAGFAPAVAGSGLGPAAARAALGFLGVPYRWGGAAPDGFDCSGLVQYVYARLGVGLPRVAADQARAGAPVAREALQPGDAVFFADSTGYVHHEGLALGGGRFVHAPHTGDVVKISSLGEPYYAAQYAGARRY